MTDKEWEDETRLRLDCSLKARLFKPKEVEIILDFIHTENHHLTDEVTVHSK
jgi:hypothetical protein